MKLKNKLCAIFLYWPVDSADAIVNFIGVGIEPVIVIPFCIFRISIYSYIVDFMERVSLRVCSNLNRINL